MADLTKIFQCVRMTAIHSRGRFPLLVTRSLCSSLCQLLFVGGEGERD